MKNCEFMFHIITVVFSIISVVYTKTFAVMFFVAPLMLVISVICNYKFCKDMNYVCKKCKPFQSFFSFYLQFGIKV